MVSESPGIGCVAPLFVPADRPERFEKAARSGADAVILDLEDAVSAGSKVTARANLRTDFTDLPVFVRVNAIGMPWHREDLDAVEPLPIAGIVLPKATHGQDLARISSRHPIIALIETAAGMAEARAVAAHPSVGRLAFGSIDYSADLGCAHEREALLAARCELVLASRVAGITAPLDGVTACLKDVELAADDARHAAKLGFGGKMCVHPRQIAAVRSGMRPSHKEIAWAREVLATAGSVAAIGGSMVDLPVRLRAERILSRAAP